MVATLRASCCYGMAISCDIMKESSPATGEGEPNEAKATSEIAKARRLFDAMR